MIEGEEEGGHQNEGIEDVKETSGDAFKPFLEAQGTVVVCERLNGPMTKYKVVREKFDAPGVKSEMALFGFDTEYQSIKPLYTHDDVCKMEARYEPLSYQLFAKVNGRVFREIIFPPQAGKRISFVDFIVFAIAKVTLSDVAMPRSIVLVGHFNKADLPAFDDRGQLFKKLTAIRSSLVTHAYPIKLRIQFSSDPSDYEEVKVHIRDSILMAPTGRRSLEEVGKLIGIQKIKLHDDPEVELELKRNIKVVRDNAYDLYRDYALLDAEISALFFERLVAIYREITRSKLIPTALANIGIKLLLNDWKSADPPVHRLEVVGKEAVQEEVWNNDIGQFITFKEEPYIPDVHWNVDFATDCYHGGRSEQMWFGPSEIAQFTDYDLVGAYPTAMASLKLPNWKTIRETRCIDDVRSGKFGFAWVEFRFPDTVRYPTLPVRTTRGLIFPLEGESYCCAPEIELALRLGAQVKLRRGIVIDTSERLVFQSFIKTAIRLRSQAATPLENAFFKEVSNSSYGKTAQGLRDKRVFNLKSKKTKPIPESQITNPFFAAYITSDVRAVIGEIMNNIPRDRTIFSVTTDGFLTDADDAEMEQASSGPLANAFAETRRQLTGKREVLSKKHSVRRLLGCRTRGQSTLVPDDTAGDHGIVLAKAGIKTPTYTTSVSEQNDYFVETFLNRTPGQKFVVDTFTTMREIMLFNADLVTKRSERAISLEYDFKRCPSRAYDSGIDFRGKSYTHLAFATKPWRIVEEFKTAREMWESHAHERVTVIERSKDKAGKERLKKKNIRRQRYVLKTLADFQRFAAFHDTKVAIKGKGPAQLRSDESRLRLDLCTAYHRGRAGLEGLKERCSASEFAGLLNEGGFSEKVERHHVEYGVRREFEPNCTPATQTVIRILRRLKACLPELRGEEIMTSMEGLTLLLPAMNPQ